MATSSASIGSYPPVEPVSDRVTMAKAWEEVRIGETVLLISAVALAALATVVGIIPAACGTAIGLGVKVGAVCVVTNIVGSLIRKSFYEGVYTPEEREKFLKIFSLPAGVPYLVSTCVTVLPWRVMYAISKSVVSALHIQAPLAGSFATIATSLFYGNVLHRNHWLREALISQFMLFPAYFAGGLPAAILAQGVFDLIIFTADKCRYVSASVR